MHMSSFTPLLAQLAFYMLLIKPRTNHYDLYKINFITFDFPNLNAIFFKRTVKDYQIRQSCFLKYYHSFFLSFLFSFCRKWKLLSFFPQHFHDKEAGLFFLLKFNVKVLNLELLMLFRSVGLPVYFELLFFLGSISLTFYELQTFLLRQQIYAGLFGGLYGAQCNFYLCTLVMLVRVLLVKLLFVYTSNVGQSFVGESKWHFLHQMIAPGPICTFCQPFVGKIDPRCQSYRAKNHVNDKK